MAYRRWLSTLAFEHPAQQVAFQDYVDAVMDARLKGEACDADRRHHMIDCCAYVQKANTHGDRRRNKGVVAIEPVSTMAADIFQ
jgi:hypothetical protein